MPANPPAPANPEGLSAEQVEALKKHGCRCDEGAPGYESHEPENYRDCAVSDLIRALDARYLAGKVDGKAEGRGGVDPCPWCKRSRR